MTTTTDSPRTRSPPVSRLRAPTARDADPSGASSPLAGDRPAGRSLGIAAGVLVGGAVTTWAGWQLIFWINVPVGAAALIVALKILPKDRAAPASATQFDLPGALTRRAGEH